MFGQRACCTRAIVMAKFIALVVAQLCAGIAALRAQEVPDPDVTRIDVRMESGPEKAVLGTFEASSAGRAAVQPSAFLSNRGAEGGAFERKTQAPMVWLNLHKSTLHASQAPLSSGAAVSTDGVAHPAAFLDVATSPLDSIVALVQAAPVQLTEPSEGVKAASAVMREAARSAAPPSPFVRRVLDPLLGRGALACDYDFEEACPESFVPVAGQGCAPGSSYSGPCGGELRSFEGLPDGAKVRWSSQCLAWWPCKSCSRDFSAACPRGWLASDGRCQPPADYVGPCGATTFAGYNAEMLHEWSDACGAHWACRA